MDKFKVIFLTEAREFLLDLDEKSRDKIIFNIDKAKSQNNNELFKKLNSEIWEFVQKELFPHFCVLGQN